MRKSIAALLALVLTLAPALAQNGLPGGPGAQIPNSTGGGGGGSGTVTSVSVTTANGVSGAVVTPTTTPAISLTLGAITPTSVAASGVISGATVGGALVAAKTDMEAASSLVLAVTPGRVQNHPGVAKVSAQITGFATAFTINAGAYGIATGTGSISQTGTGATVLTFATPFASTNYRCQVTVTSATTVFGTASKTSAGTATIITVTSSTGAAVNADYDINCYGTQ